MNNYNIEYKLVNNLVVPPHEGGIDLMVVMPFYNEGESLAYVVGQWVEVLESSCPNYQIVLVADKPRDNSVEVAKYLIRENPKLVLLENPQNIGHGQSCLRGYTVAVSDVYLWKKKPCYFETWFVHHSINFEKISFDDWKKEIRELNKENQVLALTCNKPNCIKNGTVETVCESKGTYKLKTKIR
jgi:glycosyltransferase involved in cell wall biosynthesis